MMETKVEAFLTKYQLIERGTTILVGVSGGPDSMALLHFLWQRQKAYEVQLIAIGIDHQLRSEVSQKDMKYVATMCQKWGIPFESRRVDVLAHKEKFTVGTQLAARSLRYEVFEDVMHKYNADYLALGHHGDDQIETMVMSLTRTTTLSGLRGIPYERPFATGRIIRPLLPLTKKEIEQYCATNQINPRIDESNFTTDYTRNELRLHVVPILKNKNHDLHQTVQQLSETLQEDEAFLWQRATQLMDKVVQFNRQDLQATISSNCLVKQPVSLQRRVFRLTLNYLYKQGVPKTISYTHEQIFLQLLKDPISNKTLHFPKELFIEKSYDLLHFYFRDDDVADTSYCEQIEQVPYRLVLPNQDVLVIQKVNDLSEVDHHKLTFVYSEAELRFPLHIRHRKAGDRMSYEGLPGSKKLKDILIDDKIPRNERDKLYILTDDTETILWLIEVRKKALASSATSPYIVFEYIKSNEKGES